MFRFKKQLVIILALLFVGSVCLENTYAQRRGSSGRSSSGSKYSSGSRKSSSGSKYSSGSQKKSSGSSKYSSGSNKSSSGTSKYSSGSNKSSSGTSKYSSGSNKSSSGTSTNSRKPPSTSGSNKAKANQSATSKRKYEETKRATAPPKSSYKTADGKEVKVRTSSTQVKKIRSKPSSYYTPQARRERVTNHIEVHNYSHPTSWYYGQPSVYVGGGYSSAFWWMMMEWSAERRARWLYHNQHNIESAAYQRGLQDAAVAAQIQKLEAENLSRNPDYVDPEFVDSPDMMYSQDYIEAAYNPTVVPSGGSETALTVLIWIIIIGGVAYAVYLFTTRVRFGN